MYLEFYGLSEKPFSQTPDPRFLYWNDAYRETLASLSYGIRERKGFIAMLGEAGTGKTTLLRKLLEDLGDEIISVFLFNPNATFEEILEYTLSELGITAPSGRKLAMLQRLNEFLLAAFAEGRNTILLIDEAQDLEPDVLESLRLLSNLETSQEKILQIVLSGQPELADKLADPGLRQLKQRIAVRCRLEPLRRDELPSYIGARVTVAGGSPEIFAPEALDPIWRFTNGIPRLVNTACDNALLLGYALGRRIIDRGIIEEVIRDLENLDFGLAGRRVEEKDAEPAPAADPVPASVETAPAAATPPAADSRAAAPVASSTTDARPRRPLPPPTVVAPARPSSLPWMVAALLAGLVLLLAGAWLGRVGVPAAIVPSDREARQGSLDAVDVPAVSPEGEESDDPATADAAPDGPDAGVPVPVPESAGAPNDGPAAAPGAGPPAAPGDPAGAAPAPENRSDASEAGGAPSTDRARTLAALPNAGQAARASEPGPGIDGASARNADAARAAVVEAEAGGRESAATTAPRNGSAEPADDAETADPAEIAAIADPAVAPETADAGEPAAGTTENARARIAELPIPLQGPRRTTPTTQAPAPRKQVSVVRGDTLQELASRRYGSCNLTTLDMLRAANPEIRSIDLIIAGSGLVFPDPGPESRVLAETGGYAVLAVTTPTLATALAVQSSLEDRLEMPVSLERVANESRTNLYRVSVRGLGDRGEAVAIAERLGPILRDPTP